MNATDAAALPADAYRGLVLLARLAGRPLEEPQLARTPPGSSSFAWLARRGIDALLDDNPLQDVYNRLWSAQRRSLVEALTALSDRGIEVVVFKGAEFHERFFGRRALGMGDLDLLVRPEARHEARAELVNLGYRHGHFDPRTGDVHWMTDLEVVDAELTHYELAQLLRVEPFPVTGEEAALQVGDADRLPAWAAPGDGDGWCLGVGVDIHHGVATDMPGERFFANATAGTCGVGMSMAAADLLWFTTSRWYSELGATGTRSLREVAYVLPLFREQLDWDIVLRAAADYELGAALYYPFAFFERAFGVDIPAEVLAATDPRRTPRRRDWGWQLGPLFDFIEPPPL